MKRHHVFKRGLRALAVAGAVAALALGTVACSGPVADGSASGAGSGQAQAAKASTVMFKDSAGREVEVPAQVDRVVPSGHTATQVLLTLAPQKLAGLSQELSPEQAKYFGDAVPEDLPVLGAAFGSKGDLNKEAVAASGAQLLIDTGEYKEGMEVDLDELQEQLGIPCVFIGSKLDSWPEAYRMLGELLGVEDRAEELATYCERAFDEAQQAVDAVPADERPEMLFLTGDDGTGVLAQGSFQANVVDMLANNVAKLDNPSGKGTGSQVSLEQISLWDPELILFSAYQGSETPYDTVADDPTWSELSAIKSGNYLEVPTTPYGWLNNPPTVNQVLGLTWLPRVLYPEQFEGKATMEEAIGDYFETFYGYKLSSQEFSKLTANAMPKK